MNTIEIAETYINDATFAIDRTEDNGVVSFRLTSDKGYEIVKTDTLEALIDEVRARQGKEYCDHCGTITDAVTEYPTTFQVDYLCSDCIYQVDEGRYLRD